jgi:hypothetical protein
MNNTGNDNSTHIDPSEIHVSKGRYIRDGGAALGFVLLAALAAAGAYAFILGLSWAAALLR